MRTILLLLLTMYCGFTSVSEIDYIHVEWSGVFCGWESDHTEEIGCYPERYKAIGANLSTTKMREVLRNVEKMGRDYIDNGDIENLRCVVGVLRFPNKIFQTEGHYETFWGNEKWEEESYMVFKKRTEIYAGTRLFLLQKYAATHKKMEVK